MAAPKKFKPGDKVTVTDKRDLFYGREGVVMSLSPSTKKRRAGGSWRWRVNVGSESGYFSENVLRRIK